MMFAESYHPEIECSVHQCPRCKSNHVDTRNVAKKAGGTIGTIAGAASAVLGTAAGTTATALTGAEIGATVGLVAGPAGSVFGSVAGAILAALVGGAAGCAVGVKLGEMVDAAILNNCKCHQCGHRFSKKQH